MKIIIKLIKILMIILLCNYTNTKILSVPPNNDIQDTIKPIIKLEFSDYLVELEKVLIDIESINTYSNKEIYNIYNEYYIKLLNVDKNTINNKELYDTINFYLLNKTKYYSNDLILDIMYKDNKMFNNINSLLSLGINDNKELDKYTSEFNKIKEYIYDYNIYIKGLDYNHIYLNNNIIDNIIININKYIDYKYNNKLIEDNIIKPLKILRDTLNNIKNNNNLKDNSISTYNKGKELYEVIVSDNTSSINSVDSIYNDLINHYILIQDKLNNIYINNKQAFIDKNNYHYTMIDYKDTMDIFKDISISLYPNLDNYDYISKYSKDNSMLDILYINDNLIHNNEDIIIVNKNYILNDSLDSYYSLAYNGYLGKLYFNNYYKNNTNNINRYINFKGTNNSLITFNSINSYKYIIDNKDISDIMSIEKEINIVLLSILDIGINYYNWDNNTIYNKLKELNINDNYINNNIDIYTKLVKNEPGKSLSYSYGLINYNKMYNDTINNNKDILEYNKFIVNNYNKPLFIIKDNYNKYIGDNNE